MIHPLIVGNIRHDPSKLLLSGLLIAIDSGVLLLQIGIIRATHEGHAQALVSHWLSGLLQFVFWVAVLISAINGYLDVVERNSEFGLLRILGASQAYFFVLLLQETVLFTAVASLPGVFFAYLAGEMFVLASVGLVTVAIPYPWFPGIMAIVALPALLGALCALPKAVDEGIKAAL